MAEIMTEMGAVSPWFIEKTLSSDWCLIFFISIKFDTN